MLYFDHNASTPIDPAVLAEMQAWLAGDGANPSSSHEPGRRGRHAIDRSRRQVATALHCAEDEVVFTSGGTESNNLAILGAARASGKKHVLSCVAEHSSTLGPLKQLSAEGFSVDLLPVDSECRVDKNEVLRRVRPDTGLLSLMLANNEIGSIQPVEEIAMALPDSVVFHCDAVQAVGKIPVDFKKLGVDLLSVSAHKFYGPGGAGALIAKKGTPLQPTQFGGGQENEIRPGSENVPAIVGLGKAIELSQERLTKYQKQSSAIGQSFRKRIQQKFPAASVNTPDKQALSNTLNVTFPKIDGRSLLIQLDLMGVAVSLGSACASGSILPSHVLLAMGKTREGALSSLRFSWGWGAEESDLDRLFESLEKIFISLSNFSRGNSK